MNYQLHWTQTATCMQLHAKPTSNPTADELYGFYTSIQIHIRTLSHSQKHRTSWHFKNELLFCCATHHFSTEPKFYFACWLLLAVFFSDRFWKSWSVRKCVLQTVEVNPTAIKMVEYFSLPTKNFILCIASIIPYNIDIVFLIWYLLNCC